MSLKKFISAALLLLLVSVSAFAQTLVKGMVSDKDGNPIVGANVVWENTTVGVVTDVDGNFEIPESPHSSNIQVSYIGYQSQTMNVSDPSKKICFTLDGEIELQEVVVSERKAATLTSRITPIQTQTITSDELCRAACCNLAESFETNPSVDVSYSDAATGAKQIKLLGLAGTYVQMMTEQIPNLQGAASPYGLNYIPGPWMESIQVSKGTASVKNGFEALTGQINVEYKKPQTADPLSVNLFASDAGRVEANVDANVALNKNLSTGMLVHYSTEQGTHDANDDGFMDLPKTEQLNLINRWYYKKGNFMSQWVANVLHEQRNSGQTHSTHDPYKIDIETNRGVLYTKNGYILNKEKNTSVALLASASYHNQDSYFGKTDYDVTQRNLYANLVFETELDEKNKISTGISNVYDYYDESLGNTLGNKVIQGQENLDMRRHYNVSGAYFQYTWSPSEKFTLLGGLRADYHNQFGSFVTPRLHLKYDPFGQYLNLRASVGKGYRVANVLVENSYLLASSRQIDIAQNLDPFEKAWNYGLSAHSTFPLFGRDMSVMLEWYYTDFENQVVADMESPSSVRFYNLSGRSYAQNAQIEVSYPFFRGFTLTGAYRLTDTRSTYDGQLKEKPLTNRYKGLVTASYQTRLKKWQYDVTGQFNGGGRMPNPGTEGLWNSYFPSYFTLNAQVTKNFRDWSVYVGGENITGYKQKNPIIDAANPWGDDSRFDASMVWGPMHGAKFYVGLRWSISAE